MDRVRQEFDTRQYDSNQDLHSEDCRFRIKTRIEIDKRENVININTHEYHRPPNSGTESFNTKVVLADWDSIRQLHQLIGKHLRKQDGRTRSVTFKAESGHSRSTTSSIPAGDVNEVKFVLDESELQVSTGGPSMARLPFYKSSIDLETQDRENIIEFKDLLEEVIEYESNKSVIKIKNPDLLADAEPEYQNGHYQSAVKTAFRVLEEKIRKKGDFEADMTGSNLAQEAFKKGGELEIGNLSSEIRGWMFLYAGSFLALRNPPSHRDVPEINQDRAKQILSFADMLLQKLEEEHS